MKVLIVNTNAREGSIGKIAFGLYSYLTNNGHEAIVCYRSINEEKIDNSHFIELESRLEFYFAVFMARLTGLESHFSFFSTRNL